LIDHIDWAGMSPFFRSAQEMKRIRKKLAVEKKRIAQLIAKTVMGIPFFIR
jgi:pyruvate kinase